MSTLPHIYYINLDSSKERRIYMEKMMDDYDLKYARVSAVNGKYIDGLNFTKCSKLEIACTLSHLLAIKKAYDDRRDIAFIVEDDLVIDYFMNHIYEFKKIINEAPKDYEIIQLMNSNELFVKICTEIYKKNINFIKWQQYSWGTVIYMINRKGMKNIIDKNFNGSTIIIPVDKNYKYTADYHIYKTCKTYSITRIFFTTLCNNSTIHPRHIKYLHIPAGKEILKNQQLPFQKI